VSRTVSSPRSAARHRYRRWALASRLVAWHLTACRAPIALSQLVGCAVLLRVVLQTPLVQAPGGVAPQLPVLLEGVAAAIVAGTCHDPLVTAGRPGAGAGVRLIRFGASVAMTAAAVGLLALGSAGQHLPGGEAALVRNTAGLCGVGLFWAGLLGAELAWVGPAAMTVLCEFVLAGSVEVGQGPVWLWPTEPPRSLGAVLCAGAVLAAGAGMVTICQLDAPPGASRR
jgi:hypothetical protein